MFNNPYYQEGLEEYIEWRREYFLDNYQELCGRVDKTGEVVSEPFNPYAFCNRCNEKGTLTINVAIDQSYKYGATCDKCGVWLKLRTDKKEYIDAFVKPSESSRSKDRLWLDPTKHEVEYAKVFSADHILSEDNGEVDITFRKRFSNAHKEKEIKCSFDGCKESSYTVGVQNHHYGPKAVFGSDADRYPSGYLCLSHHSSWHEKMNNYEYSEGLGVTGWQAI